MSDGSAICAQGRNISDALLSNCCTVGTMQSSIADKPMTSISDVHVALRQEAGA